jgi:hypothetical protein
MGLAPVTIFWVADRETRRLPALSLHGWGGKLIKSPVTPGPDLSGNSAVDQVHLIVHPHLLPHAEVRDENCNVHPPPFAHFSRECAVLFAVLEHWRCGYLPHLNRYVDQPEPGVEGRPESRYIGSSHLEDERIVARKPYADRRPLSNIVHLLADGEVEGSGVVGNEPERRGMGQGATSRV